MFRAQPEDRRRFATKSVNLWPYEHRPGTSFVASRFVHRLRLYPGFRESPLTSSPEMQVFLHIGAHKTGTSTIQAALSAGGDFLYPATGRDGRRGHYPLAWSVVGRYRRRYSVPPASIWSDLDAELRESDREKAIISSEFFWRAEPDEAERIRSYLQEHDVTAILYVRHPADYLVSYYKQEVKTGVCRKSFRDFVAEKLPLADFAAYADRWAGAMPTEVR